MGANRKGKIYFVDVGPGDARFLTFSALDCLHKADCVVYDEIIDKSIIDQATDAAELVAVADGVETSASSREAVLAILQDRTGKGLTVARLRWGGSFLFSGLDRETADIAEQALAYEVIPGVGILSIIKAYTGFSFVSPASIAFWCGRDDFSRTFGMPESACFCVDDEDITDFIGSLVGRGFSASEPAVVVERLSYPDQNLFSGTVQELAAFTYRQGKGKRFLLVGKLVEDKCGGTWFAGKPLLGKNVLLVEPGDTTAHLRALIAEQGAVVKNMPVSRVFLSNYQVEGENRDELSSVLLGMGDIAFGGQTTWVVFIGQAAVEAVWKHMARLKLDARIFFGVGLCAADESAARALAKNGLTADMRADATPTGTTWDEIEKRLGDYINECHFIIFSGDNESDRLRDRMESVGASCRNVVVYSTRVVNDDEAGIRSVFDNAHIDLMPFASRRAVHDFSRLFLDRMGFWFSQSDRPLCTAMNSEAADEMLRAGIPLDATALEATPEGLVDALIKAVNTKHARY
jgi:Uroporphyrinogen-III methylase